MAVTVEDYSATATWTASGLADIFRDAFIDAGLMTVWYDSFLNTVENRVLEVQFQRWFSGERTKMNEDRFAAIGIFLSYDSLRQLVFALGSRTEHVVTTLASEMFVTKSR